jgi:glucosamine 6-phosphate synthetase-like amidotransferase/phosphosugar isomerase protein
MCGICGYAGVRQHAAPILREMLVTMEKYKLGYESAGIATVHKKKIVCLKNVGQVEKVFPPTGVWSESLLGSIGLGHVRYPSPKAPTGKSMFAHPFQSCDGKIALVHNGTIYDYREIMRGLKRHNFSSLDKASNRLNDSEVIVHLLEEEIEKSDGNIVEAIRKTYQRLSENPKNQFLFAFIHLNEPGKIHVVSGKDYESKRKVVVAFKDGFGSLFASYRNKGIGNRKPLKFEALRSFVNPRLDKVEVLDYDTLAVLTEECYHLTPLTG